MSASTRECDICLVTDATGSMSSSLEAVKISMGQFAYMQTLLGQTGRIGIEAYYDYSDPEVIKWLGWHSNPKSATEAAAKIELGNGHDTPEAVRTGVFELLKQIDPQRRTIVFWYADAPPHYKVDDSFTGSMQKHLDAEKKALGDNFDWTKLCEQLRDANVVVNPIIDTDEWEIARFFAFMAKKTGGYTIRVPKHASSDKIADATINLMLAFLGAEYNKEKLVWLSSESDLDKSGSFQKKFATPAAVPELQQDLNALITRFKADPQYRDQVYEAFESLSTPENIYAITVNSVLGKLFRTICGQRNDPRRDALLVHFSAAKSAAPKSLQPHIQEWLDQSYNRTEEINGEINEVEQKWPALVLDQKESWTAQELLEITRSCDPKVLARMSLLLAEIQLTDTPTKGRFIPIAMADRRIFALIPHLMCEGTEFSGLRAGVIVAMMAVITHQSLLEQRAKSWLQSVAGKWFGKDISENFSLSFVRLALQTNQLMEGKFLTEEEFKFFGFLKRLGGLVANQLTELNLKQPRHAEGQLSADDKLKCHKCGEFRSFTLMTRGQICGLCHYDTLGKENPEKVEGKSRWYECRKCYAHYAVVQVEKLKCTPKCYFCRENQVAPTIECSKCRNKFVTPNGLTGVENVSQSDLKSYVCPPCRDGEKSTSDVAVAVQKFFDQNIPAILACFALEMPPGYNPFDKRSLFVMVNDVKPSATVSPLKDVQNSFGSTMVNRGKPVLNGCEVLQQMVDWVQSDSAQEHSCMLCFSAVSRRQPLQKSCGRRGCLAQACDSCLQSWYGSMKPGELIFPSQLSCPFCKRTPTAKRISAYNKEICWLMPSVEKFDPDWLYAWCRSCYQPKRFLERNCAQHQLPHLDNFECQECVEARLEAIRIADEAELEEQRQAEGGGQPAHRKFKQIKWNTKKCPKCTVKTQKDGGCNHMTCPCGAHWCWVCGKELSYEKIYDHLNAEHGGIYGDNEED